MSKYVCAKKYDITKRIATFNTKLKLISLTNIPLRFFFTSITLLANPYSDRMPREKGTGQAIIAIRKIAATGDCHDWIRYGESISVTFADIPTIYYLLLYDNEQSMKSFGNFFNQIQPFLEFGILIYI